MNKKIKIFGYGSLINKESLLKTAPSATDIIPCKLFGFIRIFNAKNINICEKNKKCSAALNIEKSEYNQYINGVVFEIDDEDFPNLKKRERNYELIKINLIDYNGKSFSAYTFRYPHFEVECEFLFDSEVQKQYLKLCIQGAKTFGEDFYEEFLKTTQLKENLSLIESKNRINYL